MHTTNNIGLKCIALLMAGLLLFPIVVQASHGFTGHEHESCNDLTTHVHKTIVKCELDDLRLPVFYNFSFELDLKPVVQIPRTVSIIWRDCFTSLDHNTTPGRAPPVG